METITVYAETTAAAAPIAPQNEAPPSPETAPQPASPNSATQLSSSQSTNIAIWAPVGVVLAVMIIVLCWWALSRNRRDVRKRGDRNQFQVETRSKIFGARRPLKRQDRGGSGGVRPVDVDED